jgi:FkbM family methyltransferase
VIARVVEILQTNSPRSKPQLWEDVGFSVGRRLRYMTRRALVPGWEDRPHRVRLRDSGLTMDVVPREFIARNIYLYGIWEIVGTRLLQALLRPGMRFLDIGANIGYYTLLAADLVKPSGDVHSFEPHDGIRAQLRRNVELNQLRNVQVRAEAVSARSGTVSFYRVVHDDTNLGLSSLVPGERTEQTPISVPGTTLDDYVAQLPDGRVDVVKIDVEGAESDVLQGAQKILRSGRGPWAILLESFEISTHRAALGDCGYDTMGVHYSSHGGLEFVDPADSARIAHLRRNFRGQATFDYLALKRGAPLANFDSLSGLRGRSV